MDKQLKRKIKNILIAFFILIFPITYWIRASSYFDRANEAFNIGNNSNNKAQIEKSINCINRAMRAIPWSKKLENWKYTLHYKIGDYDLALEYAKKSKNYDIASLFYETIGEPDSAKIFYYKLIDQHKQKLKKAKDEFSKLLEQRQIALLYTFIGDSISAMNYISDLSNVGYNTRGYFLRFDYYIENYDSGGYRDFIYGETICMENDCISNKYIIDSLLEVNRFNYEYYTSTQIEGKTEASLYEFKAIYQEKAEKLGFKQIDCRSQNTMINYAD